MRFSYHYSFVEMYEMTFRPRLEYMGLEGAFLVWLEMIKEEEKEENIGSPFWETEGSGRI
jgi:hypothetical protein